MKTITFYSYKGGVGRTLLLANMARYLARFGQEVFLMDFDLEAPGLHYKMKISNATESEEGVRLGIVDYIHAFREAYEMPGSLQDYVIKVEPGSEISGSIHMMPAGNILTPQYWQRLSLIDWRDLFYSDNAVGVPFFLELKARIELEYKPDYLLIDSRTGITEVGGVAATILPDYLVCLLLNNRENMEGAREVLRSIRRTMRQREQEPIELLPVVTRLPTMQETNQETQIIDEIRHFLNEEAPLLADTLALSRFEVLHIDRSIEIQEAVLLNDRSNTAQSQLRRDYLRLIARVLPTEIIKSKINPLIDNAIRRSWDEPDQIERELVELTQDHAFTEPFEALLKLYRLRHAGREKILHTALRCWQLTGPGSAHIPIMWDVVKEYLDFSNLRRNNDLLEFAEAVWRNAGAKDVEFATSLARACLTLSKRDHAIAILDEAINTHCLSDQLALIYTTIFLDMQEWEKSKRLLERYEGVLTNKSTAEKLVFEMGRYLFHTISTLDIAAHETLLDIGKLYKHVGLYKQFKDLIKQNYDDATVQSILPLIDEPDI